MTNAMVGIANPTILRDWQYYGITNFSHFYKSNVLFKDKKKHVVLAITLQGTYQIRTKI